MTTTAVVEWKIDDLERMANAIAKSGLFGVTDPLQALALMMIAQAEGLHPATVAQDYDIIQGHATRKTHSVLSRFQQAGGKVKWLELTDTCAKAEFSHPDGGTVTMDWDINRAKRTTVWNKKKNAYEPLSERHMYQTYPRAMLRARCIAEGVRAVYPAALGGMLVPEEAQDVDEIDMGQAERIVEQPKQKPKAAAPDTATAGGGTPQGARSAQGAAAQSTQPKTETVNTDTGEIRADETIVHTLSECLDLLRTHNAAGTLDQAISEIECWRGDLSEEDQATIDTTIEGMIAEAEPEAPPATPPAKPMSDGQKRIIRARLKSAGVPLATFETKFGPIDSLSFDDFEKCQKWITEAK